MDVGGVFSKVESNADKLGALVGGLGAIHSHSWGRNIPQGISIMIERLVADPHIPNLAHVFEATKNSEVFYPSIMAIVGGYGAEAIDIDPKISRAGRAFTKAGWAALLAAFAVNVLIYSGAAHSQGADAGLGGGSHFGFLSGSRHNPHGAYTEGSIAPLGTSLTRVANGSPSPYS